MKSRDELEEALSSLGFRFDPQSGGYFKDVLPSHPLLEHLADRLWVSEGQAREALRAAQNDVSWTEDDVEPLSETFAKQLVKSGIQ